ncbi:MAG: threonine--tRNA ligase [Candidatus Vogelbacteria bacterium CG10_big_fil_rev_8_21_14_0_10_49_38]|uniref:Threonine--tRNA ligase n=1 Tax=Candidatus Vogelbacteria bacterium CG10_big_fil_rev_8_21_14_0_10_49_38 TaxID=1975043 RepID=A0A2H0RI01_9BACT|nr:MAG: threonine--tRNA ligase [bacterium CG10_49_38]PIR46070.1 MAG: threonine--tRNA ligase [Candidatus Vogelbacteria bacterium CG10_big_fil_rev_8_21_14_0_10_49_38]
MENDLNKVRHSLAHLLAITVKTRYPAVKLGIGPTIEHGFYYDFDFGETAPTETELLESEKDMRALVSQDLGFEKDEIADNEAKKLFAAEPYKLELIEELTAKGETITTYRTGGFTDLCAGPHVAHTNQIARDAFRLTRVAGAYWRGNEQNKMLTRIYGVAFANKKELDDYLEQQAEAEKRDHRKLGKELNLFVFSDLVGPGLPLYTPKGAIIRREIVNFSNELQSAIGYQEVHTPNINKAELFKVSGHYEKYQDDMLRVSSHYTKEEYFLKPMNCPQHTQIYASQKRSYRDLPVRLADFANLYRDEKPGELSGLTRLRSFAQDDGHSFCRPDQIKEEFENVLAAIKQALTVYGMDYYIRFSTWDPEHPEKYLGDPKTWETAQDKLKEILVDNKIDYRDGIGEAAIYGPKMDFISRDSLGREWQISTIQIDFIMPERFGLRYTDQDGSEKTPVMVHRAIVGSPERFLGILIEHYAGRFPVWLSPGQVKVIPISDKHLPYAQEVTEKLKGEGVRIELDQSNETLGKKIRAAKMQKVPYLIVLGDKEVTEQMITIESRDAETSVKLSLDEFRAKILEEIKTRS